MGATIGGPKGNVSFDGLPLGTVNGEIALKIMGTGGGGFPVTPPAGPYTASVSSLAADGSVAAGARSVTFIFSSDFTGTIAGGAFAGATDASVDFVGPLGSTLGAIAVTVSAGTVRIAKVV